MNLQGHPIAADLSPDLGLRDRFWYWQGASGRKYIHSIYEPNNCPPLPGALYVGVRRDGGGRQAVILGRFLVPAGFGVVQPMFSGLDLDEIHVHLLARNPAEASAILADLQRAFAPEAKDHPAGFHEAATVTPLATAPRRTPPAPRQIELAFG